MFFIIEYDFCKVLALPYEWTLSTSGLRLAKYVVFVKEKDLSWSPRKDKHIENQRALSYL